MYFLLSQGEVCAMKSLALVGLGILFAFALGFLFMNYVNSFTIAKETDLKKQFLPTIRVAEAQNWNYS